MKLENTLVTNEKMICSADFNKNNYIGDVLMMPIVIGFFTFIKHWLEHKTTQLLITSRRILCREGIIGCKITEIPLTKIDSCEVNYTFCGRILNYGEVAVDMDGTKVVLGTLNSPMSFKKHLEEAVIAAKKD